MSRLKAIWSELLGLFVDDRRFALAIVGWIILCWLALPWLRLPAAVPAAVLFAGLIAILAMSVVRRAGQDE